MKDRRVDEYIAQAPAFARPILKELRARVHAQIPDAVETIKWSAPYFEYKGEMLAGMAAFKAHCAFGFWHPLMREGGDKSPEGLGLYRPIRALTDLPSKGAFAQLARKAQGLIDDAVKGPRLAAKRPVLAMPRDLAAALDANAKARAGFEALSPSCRREYIKWIEEAKRDETRAKRVAQTLAQAAQGRKLYWKYEAK